MNAVKRYQKRRASRLAKRGYRFDEEDGEWRTTDNGHKILIKDGVVVGGNPFAVATMGKPNVEIPKKSVEIKKSNPFDAIKNMSEEEKESFGEAFRNRKDKNCIFGGFYKVAETSSASMTDAVFFNPYTGETFSARVRDTGDDRNEHEFANEFKDMSVNQDALWCWNRSNGVVQKNDTVKVVRGRTLEHGTQAKVKNLYTNTYGGKEVTYAYLDNGDKINVDNVAIVEGDKVVDRHLGTKETKVSGSKGRKYTVRFSKGEQDYFNELADKITRDISSGKESGVRASARQFIKGTPMAIEKDGVETEYLVDKPQDFVDEIIKAVRESKNVKVKTKW